MATLTNTKIKDTYDGLLKTTDNDVIGASEKVITDGLGNASVLSIGTASASFSNDVTVTGDVTATSFYGDGSNLTNIASNLQEITDNGSVTTNNITANSFIKSGGVSTEFLKADGSVDSNTYLTAESDTLDAVTSRGNTTTNGINVGLLNANNSGTHFIGVGAASTGLSGFADNLLIEETANTGMTIYSATTGLGSIHFADSDDNDAGYIRYDHTNDLLKLKGVAGVSVDIGTGDFSVPSIDTSSDITINRIPFGRGSSTAGNDTSIAIGIDTLTTVAPYIGNIAIGFQALKVTESSGCIAIGTSALTNQTTGIQNQAFGSGALLSNTTGDDNTAIGRSTLDANTTGDKNTALGNFAGETNTTGSNNLYLGYGADTSSTGNSNEIVIGYNATGNGSNTATYGNSSITDHHFTSGTVRINSDYLRLTGATNPQVLVTDTTNSVSVGLQALDASTKIESTHSFKTSIANNIIHSVTSSGVEITGNLAVDTNTLYVDAASDSVSINDNVTANVPLTVTTNSGYEDVLYLKSSGTNIDSRISMFPTGTGNAVINAATNSLEFQTGGSEKMRIDSSGNVGIGATPSAWSLSGLTALQIRNAGLYGYDLNEVGVTANAYYNGGWKYISSDSASMYLQDTNSNHIFRHAASGTAGAAITWSESMRIDSSGNVGIGTSGGKKNVFIDKALTIVSGGVGTQSAIELSGNNTSNTYISGVTFHNEQSTDTVAGKRIAQIYTQRDGADNAGALIFDTHDSSTTLAERMRIDSSGNVGIGESNPEQFAFAGKELHIYGGSGVNQGAIVSIASSQSANRFLGALTFVNGSATNEFQRRVGQIGIDADSGGADTSRMTFFTKGGVGDFAERMRILSSGGITFNGDTATANALDDYEEGTWTPVLGGTWITNPTGLTGNYTKIGRVVYIQLKFTGGAKSTSVSGYFTGLPYATNFTGSASLTNAGVQDKGTALFANTDRVWVSEISFGTSDTQLTGFYFTNA